MDAVLRLGTPVNPARAGMIRIVWRGITSGVCKPRASGDDPHDYYL